MIKQLREKIERSRCNNIGISEEEYAYIDENFMGVDSNDYTGRKWHKVHRAKYDSKYGAFMICLDTKQWRNTTMEEFYGGAVID